MGDIKGKTDKARIGKAARSPRALKTRDINETKLQTPYNTTSKQTIH
jgi:hypothetical protein